MAAPPTTPRSGSLFRTEALAHRAAAPVEGDVLRLPPSWTRWTYWLVVAVVLAGAAAVALGRVQRYASGPAVVRFDGAGRVTAPVAGVVARVHAVRGARIEAGDAIVELDDAAERAEEHRLEAAFEERLVARLFDPTDEEAARALEALRGELDRVRAARERLVVRTSAAGTVDDVRTRAGRAVAAGEVLVTLRGAGARPTLVALLPGAVRPQLAERLRLRVELPGRRATPVWVEGGTVSASVVGPAEARRMLGGEIADALDIAGAVTCVEVALEHDALDVDGREARLFDGMALTVEAPLGRESLLTVLFPGLRGILGGDEDAGRP